MMTAETINIQFSGEEFNAILEYQKSIKAESVQEAILNAIGTVGKLQNLLSEVNERAENAQTNADKIRAMDRDEGIRIGVELAAMHGADATSKQLEDAFWCGFEEAMKKRDVVVQKHGKWILKQEYDICEEDGEKYWECSLCGCGSDSYDTTFHTKFCPNCGAKMEVEHEV